MKSKLNCNDTVNISQYIDDDYNIYPTALFVSDKIILKL